MENITLGQLGTAIGFLVALIGGIEFLAYRMRNYIKNTMKDEIEPLKVELNRNSLNTMKNTICNECIPLTERVSVGKEYIDKGGNGAIKILVHKLEEELEAKLQKEQRL